jgi:hypothetical protein
MLVKRKHAFFPATVNDQCVEVAEVVDAFQKAARALDRTIDRADAPLAQRDASDGLHARVRQNGLRGVDESVGTEFVRARQANHANAHIRADLLDRDDVVPHVAVQLHEEGAQVLRRLRLDRARHGEEHRAEHARGEGPHDGRNRHLALHRESGCDAVRRAAGAGIAASGGDATSQESALPASVRVTSG